MPELGSILEVFTIGCWLARTELKAPKEIVPATAPASSEVGTQPMVAETLLGQFHAASNTVLLGEVSR